MGKRAAMFLIAAAVGCLEGLLLHRQYETGQAEASHVWHARLVQQAGEQGRLIESWVDYRVGDARVLSTFPAVRQLVDPVAVKAATPAERKRRSGHASDVLASFVQVRGYRSGLLLGDDGQVLAAAGEPFPPALVSELRSRPPAGGLAADMVYTPLGPLVEFTVEVSRASQDAGPRPVVVLLADPRSRLFSQLVRRPHFSETGEALLLGLEAGRPVHLTSVHPPLPVSTHGFPTARGYAYRGGALQPTLTTDDRGEEVLVATRSVAGTPWTLVLKVDRREAAGLVAAGAFPGFGWVAGLAVLQLGLVLAVLRRRRAAHVKQQREAADRLAFLNSLYRTISEVDELIVREKNRQRLLDETCRIIVAHAGFRTAWIGELGPDGRVAPSAHAGEGHGSLDGTEGRADDPSTGRGPTDRAVRERRTVVVDERAIEHGMALWRAQAFERGYRSSAAVPLLAGDRVLGALMVYSAEPLLRGEAVPLLEKLAGSLAYALDVVALEARHRETTRALSASEEQLRQAQKMEAIGRLAGGIAHDFNNLLMVISGYADAALSTRADDRRRRSLEEIQAAAERATELTRQLVAFSRKQVLQPKVLNLNDVVLRAEGLLRRLIAENIEIVIDRAEALRSVVADPSQMEQVLLNLAVNARDAMPGGGRIIIQTANATLDSPRLVAGAELPPGDYVVVSVRDTGDGMPDEVLEHLFEPFFTTKELGKGTGLGLSMVYGIVRQSGGAIEVESAKGHGSTFRVYLPATEAAAVQPVPVQPDSHRGRGRESVLVVEDNDQVRHFVAGVLRDAGYQVTDAATPVPALAMLGTDDSAFDLLLTDIVLPEMDGYELARQAVVAQPGLRVLYMSGYTDNPRLREDALRTGIDLLEKPFGARDLTSRVRQALDRPRLNPARA